MTPRVSLVVATLGRVAALDVLLASLAAQAGPSFEVVVVEQNGDGRLDAVLARHGAAMPIRHLRSPTRGVSHIRNLGLLHCRAGAGFAGGVVGLDGGERRFGRGLSGYFTP